MSLVNGCLIQNLSIIEIKFVIHRYYFRDYFFALRNIEGYHRYFFWQTHSKLAQLGVKSHFQTLTLKIGMPKRILSQISFVSFQISTPVILGFSVETFSQWIYLINFIINCSVNQHIWYPNIQFAQQWNF